MPKVTLEQANEFSRQNDAANRAAVESLASATPSSAPGVIPADTPARRVQLAATMPAFDDLSLRIQRQDQLVRDGQYMPIGRLERIQIEPSGIPQTLTTSEGRTVPNPLVNDKARTASLDWMNSGPLLGVSANQQDLLIVPPLGFPPPIPDPHWQHPKMHDAQGNYIPGIIKPDDAHVPKVPQVLAEFSWGVCTLGVERFLVFQPIFQMLILSQSADMTAFNAWRGGVQQTDNSGMMIADWKADLAGKHCMLLWNVQTGVAHFLGGSFQLKRWY